MQICGQAENFEPENNKNLDDYMVWSNILAYWADIQALKKVTRENKVSMEWNGKMDVIARGVILSTTFLVIIGLIVWKLKSRISAIQRRPVEIGLGTLSGLAQGLRQEQIQEPQPRYSQNISNY